MVLKLDSDVTWYGNLAVLAFLVVQGLDGVLTYLGMTIWGPAIEANPLISSAVSYVGLGTGLAAAKLLAGAFGIVLHLRRVHHVVALLTMVYVLLAIVPWTVLLTMSGTG